MTTRLLTLHCSLQTIPADAYYGSNTTLRETMNNLILKQPQSWQTSVGLPFFQIQGTVSQDHAYPLQWAISCLPLTRAACFAHCSWISRS